MSSRDSESELSSPSESSSTESLTLTKTFWTDGGFDEESNSFVVQTGAVQVPIVLSSFLAGNKRPHGGSTIGREYIRRDRKDRHELIKKDYFSGDKSKYTADKFRRRFRMDIELFERILHAVENYDNYFTQKVDAVGNIGLSPLQKCVAAIRMLAYGCSADSLDEYVQIGESTAIECLKKFCDAIIGLFEEKYMRKPNKSDVASLLEESEARGFPGMLGSLDCMHWHWKNCPTAWHGTFTNGFKKVPTLILEIVASHSLWIWHAFFGMAGTNNDVNVLDRSPLFDDLVNDIAPKCDFVIQGHHYNMGYYLSDGIYPQYATLIQTISQPTSMKEKLFAKCQESIRKDVERAFGVLQSRWHIVKGPARMWSVTDLGKIMKTCIILHNMIIESEVDQGINPENWQPESEEAVESVTLEHDFTYLVSRINNRMKQIQDKRVHKDLKRDLINHLWEVYGGQRED
ncbi:unnamed protein product [Cuscuta epithymum]|uniref:Harbinger transposase-derived protein n=1 Tax=Cuscuta epithymum TaxID=186058 RepID=A0AAV0E4Q4_9ASTE|nr:unnamed protein product [Cuscuta epithymum]